jgi:serine/threonine-protein kinase
VCQQESEAANCPADGAATVMVGVGAQALVGQVVLQRYRIEALIGEGGFGAVYRAVHTGTGDVVAVKVLRNDQQSSTEMVARFQQEAAVTARLKQPHTVRVFDFGQMESGDLFLAMEFLDGRTLTAALAGPAMTAQQVVRIASQVCKSLAEAHDSGLVHRDLKPDNIFLQRIHGEDEFVKVLDFGIAKSLVGASGAKTATGVIVGTPPYMSPEQARGTGVDVRTDIYALGCILYELLTGQVPFPGESALDTLIARITEPPPRAHDRLRIPAPPALCDVVLRAMATDPAHRFASVRELADALQQAVAAPSVQMPVITAIPAPASASWDGPSGAQPAVTSSATAVAPAPTTVARAASSSRLALPVRSSTTTTRVMQQKRPPMAVVVGGGVAVVALASLTLLARPNAQPMAVTPPAAHGPAAPTQPSPQPVAPAAPVQGNPAPVVAPSPSPAETPEGQNRALEIQSAEPADLKPTAAKPAESKLAEAKPAEAKPAESKLAEAKPAEAKPAEAKSAKPKAVKVRKADRDDDFNLP